LKRRMTAILSLVLLAVVGCGLDENKGILMAAGSYSDLAVVLSSEEFKPAARRIIDEMNSKTTFVIKDEGLFVPEFYGPDRWDLAKGFKNSLFVLRLGDGSKAERAVRSLLSDDAWNRLINGNGGIVQVNDPWSTYQTLLVVASRDANSLASMLRNNGPRIRTLLEESSRTRILRRNRYDGLNTALMNAYWDQFGFYLELPQAFDQNQFKPDGYPGLELMRKAPSRGISLSWSGVDDPAALLDDRAALQAIREDMGAKLHNEDIVPESFKWQATEIGGVPCLKLEGAWTSRIFAGGGPFWTYFIPDPTRDRMICLDLLVYAPGDDKMGMFRQLDAVASTFTFTRPQP